MPRPVDFKCWWNFLSLHLLYCISKCIFEWFSKFSLQSYLIGILRDTNSEFFLNYITDSMMLRTNIFFLFELDIYHFLSERNLSPSWIFEKKSWMALFTKILTQLSLIKKYLYIVIHLNPLYIEGWLFHFPAFIITQL